MPSELVSHVHHAAEQERNTAEAAATFNQPAAAGHAAACALLCCYGAASEWDGNDADCLHMLWRTSDQLAYLNCTQVAFAWHRVWWVPQPQPIDAPATVFSEGRAMNMTRILADDIGDRAVRLNEVVPSTFT